jgi:hypothetical protein
MAAAIPQAGVPPEFLPELDVRAPERQRRWTVLLRLLLLIPQHIVVYFLGIAAPVVAFVGWVAALFLGRLPLWTAEFLAGFLCYYTRVDAYAVLLVDTYPPFRWHAPDYPVTIQVAPGRLNRLAVFFRFILVIPAAIVTEVLTSGWLVLAFFFWLIVLVLGRNPRTIFDATAAVFRYVFRTRAYLLLLTPAYPKRLFGDEQQRLERQQQPETPEHVGGTRPLLLSSGGRNLLIAIIVLGVLSLLSGSLAPSWLSPGQSSPAPAMSGATR